ncbi:hypothetical protein QVD99_008556 [Batrachochytrium dendrobatidis]|nr:hypothetical protein QVD99_008556 [Batrachochytrium dendrobatidis]
MVTSKTIRNIRFVDPSLGSEHIHHNTYSKSSEPATPDSRFSTTAGIDRIQPITSLWHPCHSHLVVSLCDSLMHLDKSLNGFADVSSPTRSGLFSNPSTASSSAALVTIHTVNRSLLHELLPIIVEQFPSSDRSNAMQSENDLQSDNHHKLSDSTRVMDTLFDPFTSKSASRSVQAAQACISALNYAICLEAAWHRDALKSILPIDPLLQQKLSQDKIHAGKIRILLVALFVLLSRRMDRNKLLAVFMTPILRNVNADTSSAWSMSTVTDVVCQGFMYIICPHTKSHVFGKSSVSSTLSVCQNWSVHMASKAREQLGDFMIVLRNAVGLYDQNKDRTALNIAESFIRRVLKYLSSTDHTLNNVDQLKIVLSVYGDCMHFIPSSFHTRLPPKTVKILLHPLLILKHTITHICRLAIWHPTLRNHASSVLKTAVASIRKYIKERSDSSAYPPVLMTDTNILLEICEYIEIIADAIYTGANSTNEYSAKSFAGISTSSTINMSSSTPVSSVNFLVLQSSSAELLAAWALNCSSYRVVQVFLLPFVMQLVGLESNWRVCEQLLLRFLGQEGSISEMIAFQNHHQTSSASNPWLRESVLKWLVTLACHRSLNETTSDTAQIEISTISSKLICPSTLVSIRIFAARVLGFILPIDSAISNCLISLFDDPSYQIRMHIAQVMVIVGLNSRSSDPRHTFCYHELYGNCGMTSNKMESSGTASRPRIASPYSFFLTYLDKMFFGQKSLAMSPREMETIGLWAYYITRHIMFQCPVFCDRLLKTPACANQRSIARFALDLFNRLVKLQDQATKSTQYSNQRINAGSNISGVDEDQFRRSGIMCVVSGVLEGSWMLTENISLKKRPTPPFCDAIVLDAFTPLLLRLRHDPSILVRTECVELCARLVNAKTDRVKDESILIPSSKVSLAWQDPNAADLPFLHGLYKIVLGISGNDGLVCFNLNPHGRDTMTAMNPFPFDDIDQDPNFVKLCQTVVTHGRRYHLLPFYNIQSPLNAFQPSNLDTVIKKGFSQENTSVPNPPVPVDMSEDTDADARHQPKNEHATSESTHVQSMKHSLPSTALEDGHNPMPNFTPPLLSTLAAQSHPAPKTFKSSQDQSKPTLNFFNSVDDPADTEIIQSIYADLQRQFEKASIGSRENQKSQALYVGPLPNPIIEQTNDAKKPTCDVASQSTQTLPNPTVFESVNNSHNHSTNLLDWSQSPHLETNRDISADYAAMFAATIDNIGKETQPDINSTLLQEYATKTASLQFNSADKSNQILSNDRFSIILDDIVLEQRDKLTLIDTNYKFADAVWANVAAAEHQVSEVQDDKIKFDAPKDMLSFDSVVPATPLVSMTKGDKLLKEYSSNTRGANMLLQNTTAISSPRPNFEDEVCDTDAPGLQDQKKDGLQPRIPNVMPETHPTAALFHTMRMSGLDQHSFKEHNFEESKHDTCHLPIKNTAVDRSMVVEDLNFGDNDPYDSPNGTPSRINNACTENPGASFLAPSAMPLPYQNIGTMYKEKQVLTGRHLGDGIIIDSDDPALTTTVSAFTTLGRDTSPILKNHQHAIPNNFNSTYGYANADEFSQGQYPTENLGDGSESRFSASHALMTGQSQSHLDFTSIDQSTVSPLTNPLEVPQIVRPHIPTPVIPFWPHNVSKTRQSNSDSKADVLNNHVPAISNSIVVYSTDLVANPLVRSRLFSAMELALRHLVFDTIQKQTINYSELYGDGLVYGSLLSLATLPVSQGMSKNESNKRRIRTDDDMDDFIVKEALHPALKLVFRLDQPLLIDACVDVSIPTDDQLKHRDRLSSWLHALTLVHRHLLPLSRILFKAEWRMKSKITEAQALVIVRDQISVSRQTGGGSIRAATRGLQMLKAALEADNDRDDLPPRAQSHDVRDSDESVNLNPDPKSFLQWMREAVP